MQFDSLLVGNRAGQAADLVHQLIYADRAPIFLFLGSKRGHKILAGNAHQRFGGIQVRVTLQLIQHIAEVCLRDLQGLQILYIPLRIAAHAGNRKAVPLLLQIGHNVRVGGTAIHNHLFYGGLHLRGQGVDLAVFAVAALFAI